MGTLPLNWRVPLWWEYSFPMRAFSLLAPLMLLFCLLLSAFLNCVWNEVKNDFIYSYFGLGLHAPSWHDGIASCHDASQCCPVLRWYSSWYDGFWFMFKISRICFKLIHMHRGTMHLVVVRCDLLGIFIFSLFFVLFFLLFSSTGV
jgi:hypothetical protein